MLLECVACCKCNTSYPLTYVLIKILELVESNKEI